MSEDNNAKVFYGFELGGPGGWKVAPGSPVTGLKLGEFEEFVNEREYTTSTFVASLGVDLVRYGNRWDNEERWGLSTFEAKTYGSHQVLDLSFLAQERPEAWDTALHQVLNLLDLTPTQPAAKWLACSYSG